MAKQRRVLIPIDGSNNSLRALVHVIRSARPTHRVKIHLLNVQSPLPPSLFVTRAMISEYQRKQSQAVFSRAHKILSKHNVQVEEAMRVGDPATTIVNFAKSIRCNELVMGTRGLGRLEGLVLGSVTTKVIHLARMPITIVP